MRMSTSNEISAELLSISPYLAGLPKVNVFEVPDGYFDGLADHISSVSRLRDINTDKISGDVPAGYFDELSDNILARVKEMTAENIEEEFDNLSPALQAARSTNVFDVPGNYFDELPGRVLQKIQQPVPAKTVSMSTRWWRYAAAAIMIGIIFSLSYLFLRTDTTKNDNALSAQLKTAQQFSSAKDFAEGLASLSDDEIINYLENTGNILDNSALIDAQDATELPGAFDYLLDDNTLNELLEKINAATSN